MTLNALDLFHPLVKEWFLQHVGTPTDIQIKTWPQIAKGNHVLVTAPTGSGKTLTAFLWAINNFLIDNPANPNPITPGTKTKDSKRVLYISPLKALNNDIQRNLETPLKELGLFFEKHGQKFPEIRTAVRSGDTEPAERRQTVRHPPEIFITTPESLNVLLASKSGRKILSGISTVILDEIHAVAPYKRGTYLITAVERLVRLCGEFQRIALSATVKPLDKIADFIGGFKVKQVRNDYQYVKRHVSIVQSDTQKKYNISVNFPENAPNIKKTEAWWQALSESFINEMSKNHSTLFFANSRRMVEKITRFMNEKNSGDKVYSHHGSLSKEIRRVVEKRFKDGELSGIIATGSLELGIDIGSVDEVVLIQSPYSVASAIQRIGRAGHGVGQTSTGKFYPIHSRDLIESAVLAETIAKKAIETILPMEAPLDVLAQVILSMTLLEPHDIDELYGEIRCCYAYHRLSRKEFDLVLAMLAGRYADARIRELKPRLLVDRVKNTVKARDNMSMLLFMSGGVIPDRGYFNMRDTETKAKIGELDEEFVWERSLGDAFPMGNQIWRIQRITHNDVEVKRVEKSNSLVPFWRAEEMNRSYHLSEKIGTFLEEADENLQSPDFIDTLQTRHHMTERAAKELITYLGNQKKETDASLPHRHHLLVEHFRDPVNTSDSKQTVLHTLWGGPVNRPFAFALSAAWEEKYHYPLDVFVNNDCIMINVPHAFKAEEIFDLVKPGQLKQLLRKKLESTGYFGAQFRENAQRALLLPRQGFKNRMPLWLNRLRSKKLLEAVSHYPDFPIVLETWRGCMHHQFEIETLCDLLEEISIGEIQVTETVTEKPSPFADSILWYQTNKYMYGDDAPESKLRTNLSDGLLKEVMTSSHLRPRFSQSLLESFQRKLHRTAPGYSPSSGEELLQWVRERLYIPADEWMELCAAIDRDHKDDTNGKETTDKTSAGFIATVEDRLYRIRDGETVTAIIALENLPRISHALNLSGKVRQDARKIAKQIGLENIFTEETDEVFIDFLAQWLRYYGPIPFDFPNTKLHPTAQSTNKSFCGVPRGGFLEKSPLAAGGRTAGGNKIQEALETLTEDGRILIDHFSESEEDTDREICDSENLEILLRMRRNMARPSLKPLEIDALPLFFATYQGLVSPGDSPGDLQECLENLFGYTAKAGLWESDFFPARMEPYYSSWLDTAMRENDLIWFGAGKERIGFCFDTDYELFSPVGTASNGNGAKTSNDKTENEEQQKTEATLSDLFSDTRGKLSFTDVTDSIGSGFTSGQITDSLWKLAWDGHITNDDYKTLRQGVMSRFKVDKERESAPQEPLRRRGRFGFNRWKTARPFSGNWYSIKTDRINSADAENAFENLDALDRQELVKDRIRQLFMRYGVLFRELLWNELPTLRWSAIFPVLRLMELSGEIVSGQFFKGVPGLQFCTPSALGILTRGLADDAVFWMNAADPASLCGIGLEELKPMLPHRLVTTHIVFHGKNPVLISKRHGKELQFYVDSGHPRILEYLEFFNLLVSRDFEPLKYISVETVNDEPVFESQYKDILREFGFKKDYKSMVLMKTY